MDSLKKETMVPKSLIPYKIVRFYKNEWLQPTPKPLRHHVVYLITENVLCFSIVHSTQKNVKSFSKI